MRGRTRAATAASALAALAGAALTAAALAGTGATGGPAAAVAPVPVVTAVPGPSTASTGVSTPPAGVGARPAALRPGVPSRIDVALGSPLHPSGVHATVGAHPLAAGGALYVPADPTQVSWAAQDAAPGSGRGTVILTSHVNYVIDGRTVAGAFSDLAGYPAGGRVVLSLTDGRRLAYRISEVRTYGKAQLAARPELRAELFDQTHTFGPRRTSRLLLVSCGGPFDPSTGEYEDNVFVYALPEG